METKIFCATKAFITREGKVLILRESHQYEDGTNENKYDVVGGRVKPGQRFDESLEREIKEETDLKVKIGRPFFANEWRPKVKGEQWQIIGIFFECESVTDKVALSKDHNDYKWIKPEDYKNYNLIENLYPAFEAYLNKQKNTVLGVQ